MVTKLALCADQHCHDWQDHSNLQDRKPTPLVASLTVTGDDFIGAHGRWFGCSC